MRKDTCFLATVRSACHPRPPISCRISLILDASRLSSRMDRRRNGRWLHAPPPMLLVGGHVAQQAGGEDAADGTACMDQAWRPRYLSGQPVLGAPRAGDSA